MGEEVILSLGSNLGHRSGYLEIACRFLSDHPAIQILARSPVYETQPQEMKGDQRPFLNQVVVLSTTLSPEMLHAFCREVEINLGRPGDHAVNSPRTIDIDLVAFGNRRIADPDLVVPHPRYATRRFVLVPLADIRPAFTDPATGRTVHELLACCPHHAQLHPVGILSESMC